ncbi:NADPH:quinone reductase [Alloscardovia theropitheci]|uniref:NADPH:quinone reductase n=2 Tax=Alloscardovia theropitheci TaxID=2496842 RepID=A0A4R0QVV0_9BIFI|nr:NADPH:quinone reductase [Alloscardovia theropitheci]
MKAIQLTQPCNPEELIPVEVPIPQVKPGYALIKIRAFGVNESEVTSRKGESSPDFTFPRILGIEGVGEIAQVAEGSTLSVGQKVATMMGGLGRQTDGSYAQYTLVREDLLIPFDSSLDWSILGAIPEMTQTSYGSLHSGLRIKADDTILIRGGSSTVGLMSIALAHSMGATVIATTRSQTKLQDLRDYGCDYPVLDDSSLEETIYDIAPDGVDKVLELVGMTTLHQDMSFLKDGGYACFTGALSGSWTVKEFSPFMIPQGKYLTSYAGEVRDLPAQALNDILQKIEQGEIKIPIAHTYHGLEEVSQAHINLESGKFVGKHVVVL